MTAFHLETELSLEQASAERSAVRWNNILAAIFKLMGKPERDLPNYDYPYDFEKASWDKLQMLLLQHRKFALNRQPQSFPVSPGNPKAGTPKCRCTE